MIQVHPGSILEFFNILLVPDPDVGAGLITIVGSCINGNIVTNGTIYVPPAPDSASAPSAVTSDRPVTVSLNRLSDVSALPPTDLTPRHVSLSGVLQGEVSKFVNTTDEKEGEEEQYIRGARTYSHLFDNTELERLRYLRVFSGSATKAGIFELLQGNCVFAPDKDILVITSLGNVKVPAGCVVFIMKTGNSLVVYDLHDEAGPDLKVTVGTKHVALQKPGDFVLVTEGQSKSFKDVEPTTRRIAYRRPIGPGAVSNLKVFAGEFSIPSALTQVLPLREMRASKASIDKQTVGKILKDAVIIYRMGSSAGPYNSDRKSGTF